MKLLYHTISHHWLLMPYTCTQTHTDTDTQTHTTHYTYTLHTHTDTHNTYTQHNTHTDMQTKAISRNQTCAGLQPAYAWLNKNLEMKT